VVSVVGAVVVASAVGTGALMVVDPPAAAVAVPPVSDPFAVMPIVTAETVATTAATPAITAHIMGLLRGGTGGPHCGGAR
jgi:hypothetical protein